MTEVLTPSEPTAVKAGTLDTVADVLKRLGGFPPERILMDPIPGTATEADVVRLCYGDNKRLVELYDGILVEKDMSTHAGRIGVLVAYFIERFLEDHDLGITYGADAAMRILPNQVRLPDVSFVPWSRFPNRLLPLEAIAAIAPDLAIEVLSPSNTKREMLRKRIDYFAAGVKLVWQIDSDNKTAEVYTSTEQVTTIDINGELNGADVLPGFKLSLKTLFDRAGKRQGE